MFIRSGYSAQILSTGSATEHHHRRADIGVRRRNRAPLQRRESHRGGLCLELPGIHAVKVDQDASARAAAVRVHDLAYEVHREALALVLDGHGLREVDGSAVL